MKAVEEEEKRISDSEEQEAVVTRITPVKKQGDETEESQQIINDSKSFIMPVSQEPVPVVNNGAPEGKGKSNKELSTKIVKQHMEISRLKEELE